MLAAHTLLVLFLAVLPPSGVAVADAARGAALANACAACHGPDGHSQGAIPALDTLPVADFVVAMQAFRTGARQGTVMNRIAKGLDEAEIAAVAAYFAASQKR